MANEKDKATDKPAELTESELAKVAGGHKKDEGSSKKDATP